MVYLGMAQNDLKKMMSRSHLYANVPALVQGNIDRGPHISAQKPWFPVKTSINKLIENAKRTE
jgi:hypothetical protein